MSEKIAIASDHAGLELKLYLISILEEMGFEPVNLGTDTEDSVDYPDFGILLSGEVSSGTIERGILVCGTGIGMSIVANKFKGVRAALVSDVFTARMAKEHNNANVLVIGGRIVGKTLAEEMVRSWVGAEFLAGRHQRRLDKITKIEEGCK
ncbi:MAG: ribose 5-phosphate isomerase B [Deltaproteobacteria bacterium]|nr:ribose 5-phosphate isomerase B [Deltaproteobacteria bacterium]